MSENRKDNRFCDCGAPATTMYHNARVCERCKQIDRNMYQDAKKRDERKQHHDLPAR